jgi:NAD+ synthase (glutamine-hydrolysing)
VTDPSGAVSQELKLTPFMLENVQARDRSSRILSAISNAFGGVYTCNSNKSETAVGYCTLYGDLCGYFANIADLWKTEVYDLANHLNMNIFNAEIIPKGILELVPSAELSDKQDVDQGMGDPFIYPYHDKLFKSWVEWWNRSSPEEALVHYADNTLEDYIEFDGSVRDIFPDAESFINDLERWWKMYKGMGVAKRIQAPPILAVKRRAFGFDHRESQMMPFYSEKYKELKNKLLSRS